LPREAPGAVGLVGEQVLDLAVDAPQLVVRPAVQRVEQAAVESEQ
jgi:hypothetical protein